MSDNPSISVIVPVLNEEGSLEKFYREASDSLSEFSDWEIIFIDDGSIDDSYKIIQEFADNDNRVTVIRFFKNFETNSAVRCWLSAADPPFPQKITLFLLFMLHSRN